MLDHVQATLKDHFIPHEGNGHVPHALRHRALLSYGLIAILLKIAVVVVPIVLPSSVAFSSSLTAKNVVALTNETRHALGLAALRTNAQLDEAATAKAQDMMLKGYFAHTSPAGLTGFALIKNTGYHYQFAGENLAVHYETAEGVTKGWMASPEHKANIVNARFTDIGVGVAQGIFDNYPSTIVVQLFAEPATDIAPALRAPPLESRGGNENVPAVQLHAETPKDMYAFAAGKTPAVKVLGLTIDGMNDDVRRFYFYAVMFLLGATALSVLIKYEHKFLPHAMHAIAVAALGIGLMH